MPVVMRLPSGLDGPEVAELLERCQDGDADAAQQLKALVPQLAWERFGDLAAQAMLNWTDRLSGGNPATRLAITDDLIRLGRELRADGAGPLENLLVSRILVAHLQACHADLHAAAAVERGDIALVEFHERRQTAAHRRYLSAVKALSQVRRLNVQINIGQHQTNVMGGREYLNMLDYRVNETPED